jgi:hemerythrin-like domain-containing protein
MTSRTGSSPLTLVRAPAAGFDEPFEMLAACHERVERMLVALERIMAHVDAHGADDDARSAARDVMRYFDQAAPQHHEDEERHVLPVLRDGGQGALADRLHNDHRLMAEAWAELCIDLSALADGDALAVPLVQAPGRWGEFAALYRAHVARENRDAYPLAAPAINGDLRAAMVRDMARRRGLG